MKTMSDAIVLDGLRKQYGKTTALDGLDLRVAEGSVVGLLGPNGAGKTTAVRILATLLQPDGGTAQVFGADVVREPRKVRASIGLTGQFSAVDEILTGVENLRMIGQLFRLGSAQARARADALLEAFDLADARDRQVKAYSGGMRRRLDLAASLLARPRVLVLDEPTTGLDPRSRFAMWDVIARLRSAGTTVLLTTQYLEEADRLADSIAVVDHGKLLARGTADELKAEVGGETLHARLADDADLAGAAETLARVGSGQPVIDEQAHTVSIAISGSGLDGLTEVLLELRQREIPVVDVEVQRPTLDDVFLRLTGAPAGESDNAAPGQSDGAAHRADKSSEEQDYAGTPVGAGAAGSRRSE